MAAFDEHIRQVLRNLNFLKETNFKNPSFWDWQVTIAYYTAVHIVNAHLAQVANLHYRTHEDVKNAINPFSPLALGKVNNDIYLAYTKLENLSRRSRYLCHDDPKQFNETAHLTFDKHFAKAIRHLDKIISYFQRIYKFKCEKIKIACPGLSLADKLEFFQV